MRLKEKERIEILNQALNDINQRKNYLIDGQVVSTKYAEKLYEISMREPDVWRAIKKDEYTN